MKRTILFSALGLGVLSAVAIAGSRLQAVTLAAQSSSDAAAPVVVVTQSDGSVLVAPRIRLVEGDPARVEVRYESTRSTDDAAADLERSFQVVRKRQDATEEDSQAARRAADEARTAQEQARAAFEEAQRAYRDAMSRAAQLNRAAEQRLAPDNLMTLDRLFRSKQPSTDSDSALQSRVEALERSARQRGFTLDTTRRSLEDRVAQLEEFMRSAPREPAHIYVERRVEAPEPTAPAPRTGNNWWSPGATGPVRAPTPTPPVAPTPPTPPVAPVPPRTARPVTPGAESPRNAAPRLRRALAVQPEVRVKEVDIAPEPTPSAQRADLERALTELRQEAARMRAELTRMRHEIDALPEDRRR
ncbi:MAG: hypothetical protein JNL28_05955 [Planctomycetes bacterium]|nr:hypothetical protein [Planctomycetota bacterium]